MRTLYKRDSTGKIRFWDFEIEDATGRYRTNSGAIGSKSITSEWTTPVPQNVGKSNETTAREQGLKECLAMHVKKIKEGYFEDKSKIDSGTLIKPMLAHKHGDYGITFPIYCQPKLDGIRCIITKDGMFSRKGEKFTSSPHIYEALKPWLDKGIKFDGELYNHNYRDNFNEIQSLIMKKKPTPEDLAETKIKVEYHIYDILDTQKSFEAREAMLAQISESLPSLEASPFKFVLTNHCKTQEVLDYCYGEYLKEGYEGQMIRTDTPYEFKRSKNLLKRKEFQDAEFNIVDIEEGLGNRSGMAGAILCALPDGRTFGAGIKGGVDENKRLWAERDSLRGLSATIRFQNLTPDGIPRFPVFYGIREDI